MSDPINWQGDSEAMTTLRAGGTVLLAYRDGRRVLLGTVREWTEPPVIYGDTPDAIIIDEVGPVKLPATRSEPHGGTGRVYQSKTGGWCFAVDGKPASMLSNGYQSREDAEAAMQRWIGGKSDPRPAPDWFGTLPKHGGIALEPVSPPRHVQLRDTVRINNSDWRVHAINTDDEGRVSLCLRDRYDNAINWLHITEPDPCPTSRSANS